MAQDDVHRLSDATVRRLADDHSRLEQQVYNLRTIIAQNDPRNYQVEPPPIQWLLSSGATLPAYGVAVSSLSAIFGDDEVITVAQSTGNGPSLFVAGGLDIPAGRIGIGQNQPVLRCLFDNSGTPAAGVLWGQKSGQYTLTQGGPGFVCLGAPLDKTTALFQREECLQVGILTATLNAGSSATFTFAAPSSATGGSTVYDFLLPSGGSLSSGTTIFITPLNGKWYLVNAKCPS